MFVMFLELRCKGLAVKPGFHYPSSRPEFTDRVAGPSIGPWTRAVNSGSGNRALLSTTGYAALVKLFNY